MCLFWRFVGAPMVQDDQSRSPLREHPAAAQVIQANNKPKHLHARRNQVVPVELHRRKMPMQVARKYYCHDITHVFSDPCQENLPQYVLCSGMCNVL